MLARWKHDCIGLRPDWTCGKPPSARSGFVDLEISTDRSAYHDLMEILYFKFRDTFTILPSGPFPNKDAISDMTKLSIAILGLCGVHHATAQIECLQVGSSATAKWTNAKNQVCTWTGLVGSNFGIDEGTGGK